MKPTRQTEVAFETSLLFCFRYGLGDGELQVSFRESLTLSVVVGVQSLLFLASQIQKEHSMEELLNFLYTIRQWYSYRYWPSKKLKIIASNANKILLPTDKIKTKYNKQKSVGTLRAKNKKDS